MSNWLRIADPAAYEKALPLAKGSYQRAILNGEEAMSGSTLKGSAKMKWGAAYARSRWNLLKRLTKNGIPNGIEVQRGGKRVLVIGEWVEGDAGECRYAATPVAIPRIPRVTTASEWRLAYFTLASEAVVLSAVREGRRRVAVVNVEAGTVRHARVGKRVRDARIAEFVAGAKGSIVRVCPEWVAEFQRAVAFPTRAA